MFRYSDVFVKNHHLSRFYNFHHRGRQVKEEGTPLACPFSQLDAYAPPHRFALLRRQDLLMPSRAGTDERILPSSRIARNAIQLQPAIIPIRCNKPVGAPGRTPLSSRTDTAVEAIKDAITRTPV